MLKKAYKQNSTVEFVYIYLDFSTSLMPSRQRYSPCSTIEMRYRTVVDWKSSNVNRFEATSLGVVKFSRILTDNKSHTPKTDSQKTLNNSPLIQKRLPFWLSVFF